MTNETNETTAAELTPELIQSRVEALMQLEGGHNFQLGVLAMAFAITGDAKTQQELATAMVYVQSRHILASVTQGQGITRSLRDALGISEAMLQEAGKRVDAMQNTGGQPDA